MQSIDDTREMLSEFNGRVEAAQQLGEEWLETTPEVIAFIMRKGMGTRPDGKPALHFDYKGIHICERGKLDEAMRVFEEDCNTTAHGPSEGKRVEKY